MREPSSRIRFPGRLSPTLSMAIVLTTIPLLLGSPRVSSAPDSFSEVRPARSETSPAHERVPLRFAGFFRGPGQVWGGAPDLDAVTFLASSWSHGAFLPTFGSSDSDFDEVFHTLSYAENASRLPGSIRGLWGADVGNSTSLASWFRPEHSHLPNDTRQTLADGMGSTSWGYLLPILWPNENEAATLSIRISMPPVYTAALAATLANQMIGGVDYSDPSHVGVPLLRVSGHGEMHVSPNFLVRDFATRDHAPLARIAPGLVLGLERIVQKAGLINVISGYRHRAYNASVRGARFSRHISGQAADIWSPTRSSLDLARHVIEAMGCNIGLGLGRNTLHVDVRGTLATWTYPGAPLSERAFDFWVAMLCGGQPFDLTLDAIEISWMAADSLGIDSDLASELPETPEEWIRRMGPELAAYAGSAWQSDGPGGVIINFIRGVPPARDGLAGVVRYVSVDTDEAKVYRLSALIEWIMSREEVRYFAYAAELADGTIFSGVANMDIDPIEAVAIPTARAGQADQMPNAPGRMQSVSPRRVEPPAQLAGATTPGWVIVVGSYTDPVEAEESAIRYRRILQSTSLDVKYWTDTSGGSPRYRLAVGHFGTAAEARQALRANAGRLPSDAWLLPVGQ